jgi:phosphoribosylaminoimidazole carboxylase PurE protein
MATRDGGRALVGILMGSDSDWDTMEGAAERLKTFEIPYEVNVMSAHRTPKAVAQYAQGMRRRGLGVAIVGAGGAAHLAGVVAAWTTLPVIGVPVATSSLNGLDALLATVQMPAGVPVATVAIGRGGAENAAILAAQILSLRNRPLRTRLERFKVELAESVEGKNLRLQRKISPDNAD